MTSGRWTSSAKAVVREADLGQRLVPATGAVPRDVKYQRARPPRSEAITVAVRGSLGRRSSLENRIRAWSAMGASTNPKTHSWKARRDNPTFQSSSGSPTGSRGAVSAGFGRSSPCGASAGAGWLRRYCWLRWAHGQGGDMTDDAPSGLARLSCTRAAPNM